MLEVVFQNAADGLGERHVCHVPLIERCRALHRPSNKSMSTMCPGTISSLTSASADADDPLHTELFHAKMLAR